MAIYNDSVMEIYVLQLEEPEINKENESEWCQFESWMKIEIRLNGITKVPDLYRHL